MSTNKRRKLEVSPEKPQLSAIAARRALQAGETSKGLSDNSEQITSNSKRELEHVGPSFTKSSSLIGIDGSVASTAQARDLLALDDDQDTRITSLRTPSRISNLEEDTEISAAVSRADTPEAVLERPSITLSTFKPSHETYRKLSNGKILIKLAPGERMVILGRCELCVSEGQITILGATLQKSPKVYRVYSPSSHSLPVIRCPATDVSGALLSIRQCEDGLPLLESLSPLFGKLWNDRSGPLGPEHRSLTSSSRESSYQILFSSNDGPKKVYLQPIVSPAEWNECLARLSTKPDQKRPIIVVCGPKSSGKSTFARLLTNRFLSIITKGGKDSIRDSKSGVMILDIDPGQPEYSTAGQLSLIHLLEPNFGPPFAHPRTLTTSKVIRAHNIGAVSPSLDPSLYMTCVLDLFAHYQDFLSQVPDCPLIVNTPGWVLGTGLEILEELIIKLRPTQIVYMSQEGPLEVTKALKEAAKKTPVLELPSQISEYTTRTASHLRTMQYMSYFHLKPGTEKGLSWSSVPLTSIPPWEIRYSGEDAGILGIMCYGEQPPADLLTDAINGSLVAIVVIDDKVAIPGWEDEEKGSTSSDVHNYRSELEDVSLHAFDTSLQNARMLEKPIIVRTPKEDLPYFNPANVTTLDPRHSHAIALALVRGIDTARRRIQILTPIPATEIEEINQAGKSIVLVSGKFDTPGWAYTEELVQKGMLEKKARRKAIEGEGEDEEVVVKENITPPLPDNIDAFADAPWIERLEGSQGRGVGARVWRVRRDLGKNGGDGGE
ncbi:hypothetical protein PVAG01_03073 [Phlyctema vagabunda]|uniref:Polynucleotide 5'-hydroxyl-kinase GRC3 n=1 Tax=Phlyctema vagabunda TaxID=108571 RepID=A0ABR4PSE9_9HELO